MSDDYVPDVRPTYPPIRDVLGDRAQILGAATIGGLAFMGGMYAYQMICPLFGAGG